MSSQRLWAFLAPEGFLNEALRELEYRKLRPIVQADHFFLLEGEPSPVFWSAVRWLRVERLEIQSIGDAARKLKPLAKRWALQPGAFHRRSVLVGEQLRELKAQEISFPTALALPEGAGAFTMLEENAVLWCREFDRPHPLGLVKFQEDRESAPSRAYLKLWEAFCLLGEWPQAREKTLDLGASPGGWTWVLASLGAEVVSVDRAELEPRIGKMPGVHFQRGDAFQYLPAAGREVDWLCCDVIAAPEKLLALVKEWVSAEQAKRFVCTLKFQGKADFATIEEFTRLGRILHLHHNKHELTFLR